MSGPPKKMRPVAVFDAGYVSTLAMVQSLGSRSVPIHVYSTLRWPAARLSPFCTSFAAAPSMLEFDAFQAWLKRRLLSGEIERVAPTSDLLAYHCAQLREYFPEPVRQTLHSVEEIENILIKPRFNRICQAMGQAIPETWYPESLEEALELAPRLPYPVMIKPRSHLVVGMQYRGSICASAEEFLRDFRQLQVVPGQEPLLIRYPDLCWPMVQGFEVSARQRVFSLCGLRDWQSGIVAEAAVCKIDQWPPGFGIGTTFTTLDDAATFERGRSVINRFIRHGLFQIELVVSGDERLAIDLNPRAYQMLSFDIARGNDLPWLWYQTTLGEKLLPQPPARPGLQWRRNLPFHISHLVRTLRGPARLRKWRYYRQLANAQSVSATENSPFLVRLACELRLLRHPGSLIRPYWNDRS